MSSIASKAASLDEFEREWVTGWRGVKGAAYNVVATSLFNKGLLMGRSDWRLNYLGEEVKLYLLVNNRINT